MWLYIFVGSLYSGNGTDVTCIQVLLIMFLYKYRYITHITTPKKINSYSDFPLQPYYFSIHGTSTSYTLWHLVPRTIVNVLLMILLQSCRTHLINYFLNSLHLAALDREMPDFVLCQPIISLEHRVQDMSPFWSNSSVNATCCLYSACLYRLS